MERVRRQEPPDRVRTDKAALGHCTGIYVFQGYGCLDQARLASWSHQILASFHFPAATRENLALADQGKYRMLGIISRPLPMVPLAPSDDPFTPQMGAAESPPRSTPPITTASDSGTQRSPPFLGGCDNGCMITNRKDQLLSPRFGQLLLLLAEDTCTVYSIRAGRKLGAFILSCAAALAVSDSSFR
ncbi:hypothetical protein NA56DRAFT_746397 [Hyaloscypha hepaticicola]|uniref:Uncharacterized protein n=1 Tax=Hyaloscypha hepaticicola TaxID=2082293 RepID=A0A2J6QD96_9HELO|nr:hypothetical protein NA56DRAFT_746397 [Hyaloscypha hepaticicola]